MKCRDELLNAIGSFKFENAQLPTLIRLNPKYFMRLKYELPLGDIGEPPSLLGLPYIVDDEVAESLGYKFKYANTKPVSDER